MSSKFLRFKLLLFIVSMTIFVGGQSLVTAAPYENEKASLVSKFAKYVSWPDGAIKSEFIIGVYNDEDTYQYLKAYFKNKGVNNRAISVRLVTRFSGAKAVNILYLSSKQVHLLASANKILRDYPVLFVSEGSKNLEHGMIDISYKTNTPINKLTVKINNENATDNELTLPDPSYFSNNDENVLSDKLDSSQTSIMLREQLLLKEQLENQKELLNELNKKLTLSESISQRDSQSLQETSEQLTITAQESADKSKKIISKDKALREFKKQIKIQQQKLQDLQKQATLNKEELQIQSEEKIKEQEKQLTALSNKLKKQESITSTTSKELSKITQENKTLSSFKIWFYIFIIISLIAFVLVFFLWKKSKNLVSQPIANSPNKTLLPLREKQLVQAEYIGAFGYVASDITYSIGLTLTDLLAELESKQDSNATTLKSVVTLLDNFNQMAADQDDTDIQTFDVVDYMKKMILLYDFEFNQSNITFNYSGESTLIIKSVPGYIASVLLNVINNSLKHGFNNKGNGKITLKVEKGVKSGIKITYVDDGKGMSKSVLKDVFTPFYTTRSDRGYVGVGMSSAYDLIKNKLSGDIKITSQEGKSTTVTITLP